MPLKHNLGSSIILLESSSMLLESPIMLLESSVMLLENIYLTHDNQNIFIVEAINCRYAECRDAFNVLTSYQGDLIGGISSDAFGRRRTLIVVCVVHMIAAYSAIFVRNYWCQILLNFLPCY